MHVRHHAAAQIRPVPARRIVAARQSGEALVVIRIAAEIEVIQVERTGKTLDLDLGGLGLGGGRTRIQPALSTDQGADLEKLASW